MDLYVQLLWLFLLPIPVACISWTVTHEEVFREVREYCARKSKDCKTLINRKFFFLFTCEYCFSHYITLIFICLTGYKLLMSNWIGYLIAGFSVVWMANLYMGLFELIRKTIKKEKTQIDLIEKKSNDQFSSDKNPPISK
jgi:hypothetical protein